ncbi:MAG: GNAT family N-acetyltransferase [Gammaproteobacteria bacterium]|nr:GNAT family N-acetyltransferase [Gammaproteobacteria bacterium]
MSPPVYVLAPLTDPRWDDLVARHPRASVFHTGGWLDALKRTYGYEPFALTTTAAGPLDDGLVVCRVRTWAARRLVSLPFSDHCDPLVDSADALSAMIAWLEAEIRKGGWRSIELRPRTETGGQPFRADDGPGAVRDGGQPFRVAETGRFMLHTLDLRQPAAEIFRRFHASSTQRAIRRAEREGLEYDAGRSRAHLEEFFGLLRLTRRRHGLPPQPVAWFRQLLASFGERLTIHLARHQGAAVAGILTLTFRTTMVYKYGGSDAAHHARGGMPLLFWRAVQQAQAAGLELLDLGRSDLDQDGLIAFKDHLGATRSTLTYYGIPGRPAGGPRVDVLSRAARRVAARLPDAALDLTGRVLYRHLG